MREEDGNVYGVLLMRPDHYAESGAYVYRAHDLPQLHEVIEVEDSITARRVPARVTQLWPTSDYPIHATIARPWPVG